jgi:hypothetical protein
LLQLIHHLSSCILLWTSSISHLHMVHMLTHTCVCPTSSLDWPCPSHLCMPDQILRQCTHTHLCTYVYTYCTFDTTFSSSLTATQVPILYCEGATMSLALYVSLSQTLLQAHTRT